MIADSLKAQGKLVNVRPADMSFRSLDESLASDAYKDFVEERSDRGGIAEQERARRGGWMAVYLTKTWGFASPSGPLQFSQRGRRERAREALRPGDLVVIVGTVGEETDLEERGKILV